MIAVSFTKVQLKIIEKLKKGPKTFSELSTWKTITDDKGLVKSVKNPTGLCSPRALSRNLEGLEIKNIIGSIPVERNGRKTKGYNLKIDNWEKLTIVEIEAFLKKQIGIALSKETLRSGGILTSFFQLIAITETPNKSEISDTIEEKWQKHLEQLFKNPEFHLDFLEFNKTISSLWKEVILNQFKDEEQKIIRKCEERLLEFALQKARPDQSLKDLETYSQSKFEYLYSSLKARNPNASPSDVIIINDFKAMAQNNLERKYVNIKIPNEIVNIEAEKLFNDFRYNVAKLELVLWSEEELHEILVNDSYLKEHQNIIERFWEKMPEEPKTIFLIPILGFGEYWELWRNIQLANS